MGKKVPDGYVSEESLKRKRRKSLDEAFAKMDKTTMGPPTRSNMSIELSSPMALLKLLFQLLGVGPKAYRYEGPKIPMQVEINEDRVPMKERRWGHVRESGVARNFGTGERTFSRIDKQKNPTQVNAAGKASIHIDVWPRERRDLWSGKGYSDKKDPYSLTSSMGYRPEYHELSFKEIPGTYLVGEHSSYSKKKKKTRGFGHVSVPAEAANLVANTAATKGSAKMSAVARGIDRMKSGKMGA